MSNNAEVAFLRRAAQELTPGLVINLGIGLPTRLPAYLDKADEVCLHSENGIMGVGATVVDSDADRNLIDAGGNYVSSLPGASFFDSATSFSIVRGGRLDLTIMGALQVAANGDLANWSVPGRFTPGVGGAVELAQKAARVVIVTSHRDKHGQPKIVERCSLPLTAARCVDRIYTDLAVIDIVDEQLCLREKARGVSINEIRQATGAPLNVIDETIAEF